MLKRVDILLVTVLTHALLAQGIAALFPAQGMTQTVWPLMGLSLGLYLLFGLPVLLGSAIGYFAFTFYGHYNFSVEIALLCTLAAVIQMPVAQLLLSRAARQRKKRNMTHNAIFFLIWAGPVSCLFSSALLSLVISFEDSLAGKEAALTWLTWWIRDSLSVLYFTPVVLFFKKNPYLAVPAHAWRIVSVALSFYCLAAGVFILSQIKYKTVQEQSFYRLTQPYVQQLIVVQSTISNYLDSMKGLYLASENVGREEFKAFTSIFYKGEIELRAVAWMPYVKHSERKYYKNLAKQDGIEKFEIRAVTRNGVITSPPRLFYYPIFYTEPFDKNRPALGIDVYNHPVVSETVKKSIETNSPVITPLFSLAQQQNKATGVIVYYPVYERFEEQGSNVPPLGLVEVVLELDELLSDILTRFNSEEFALRLRYGDNNEITLGNFNPDALLRNKFELPFFDKFSSVEFSSLPQYEKKFVDWTSWTAHILGFLAGLLVCVFIYTISNFNKLLEREITTKTQKLRATNIKLEQANEAKNTFLANMSHEIRTPLNGIMGAFQLLEKRPSEENIRKYVKNGKKSSHILLTLLNDILDFSKIESGKIDLDIMSTDVIELFEISMAEFNILAKEKGIELILNYDKHMHAYWLADPTRIRQVLTNLVSNSLKFTHKGSIKVYLSETENGIDFEVIDSGIGMSHSEQDKLFARFEQADKSTTRKYGGTGLGMAITKQLLDLMRGDISVVSIPDQGTTFHVHIPLQKTEPPQNSTEAHHVKAPNLVGKTLLIAEDNLINQEIFRAILEETQADIVMVENGKLAMESFKKNPPDMVFLDIQMPVMDGITACKLMREILPYIPIFSVSANTYEDDINNYYGVGFSSHIPKPIDVDYLFKEIAKFI